MGIGFALCVAHIYEGIVEYKTAHGGAATMVYPQPHARRLPQVHRTCRRSIASRIAELRDRQQR
jgi:hypothetical protein